MATRAQRAPGGRARTIALALAWAAGAAASAALVALYALSVPARLHELLVPCGAGPCAPGQRAITAAGGTASQLSPGAYAVWVVGLEVAFALVYAMVALGIFLRRTHEPMALFVAFMLVAWGTTFPPTLLALAAAGAQWFLPVAAARFTGAAAITLFFYIFPDGRFQPRWAGWLALIWIGSQIPKYFTPQSQVLNPDHWPPLLLAVVSAGFLGVMVGLQGYRYRWVSDPTRRRQTKWAVLGIACALCGYAALLLLQALDPGAVRTGTAGYLAFLAAQYATILLIPLSLAVAILRDRLYDIDLLINRTLVYGTLTVTLSLVYAATVIVLQLLLRALTGEFQRGQPLVLVASTLATAALFLPLRRRIQGEIDRRFFRRRYDAAQIVAAFGEAIRDEVDLTQVAEHLLAAVEGAMQPAHVSLWLAPWHDGQLVAPGGERAFSDESALADRAGGRA